MIRAMTFMIKVALFIWAAVWVAHRPGSVEINWLGYDLRMHIGVFIIILLATLLLFLFIYRVIRTFTDFPKSYARYSEVKRRDKGYRALTLGLTAVAAGDTKAAAQQAQKATYLLPESEGLPLLLQAQAARLEGREEDAHHIFVQLLENKDAGFLGLRGLLQAALDSGDKDTALSLAQKALKLHPKQPWILRTVYDLQIANHQWDEARQILPRATKVKAITVTQSKSDRIAMLLLEGDSNLEEGFNIKALEKFQKAYALDKSFTPTVIRLAQIYVGNAQKAKARKLIEKAWKLAPHPELAQLWGILIQKKKAVDPLATLRMYEKLAALNPEHVESHIMLACAAMSEKLWGEARDHLTKALECEETSSLYNLLAKLEERSNGEQSRIKDLQDKAKNAPMGKSWICRESGRIYPKWNAIAEPYGTFNTIIWDNPYANQNNFGTLLSRDESQDILLEAPKG